MDPSNGLLSQALKNLLVTSSNLTNLGGLPPEAQEIKAAAVALLQDECSDIKATQAEVSQFVNAYQPSIQQAKTDLENNTNIDQVATLIAQTSQAAVTLKQKTDTLSAGIANTRIRIADLSTRLAPIKSQLDSRKISLNTNLESAEQEVKSIRSNYLYLLFLGPFGLVGLISAGIALGVQENKVNDLQSQASSLRAQLSALDNLSLMVTLMGNDFLDIIGKTTNLANAVTYVSGDTSTVINDLRHVEGGQSLAKIYIVTTLHQFQTLQNDAA